MVSAGIQALPSNPKSPTHLFFKPSVWEVNPITQKLALRERGFKEVEQKC